MQPCQCAQQYLERRDLICALSDCEFVSVRLVNLQKMVVLAGEVYRHFHFLVILLVQNLELRHCGMNIDVNSVKVHLRRQQYRHASQADVSYPSFFRQTQKPIANLIYIGDEQGAADNGKELVEQLYETILVQAQNLVQIQIKQ